jgi:hypothetical protein
MQRAGIRAAIILAPNGPDERGRQLSARGECIVHNHNENVRPDLGQIEPDCDRACCGVRGCAGLWPELLRSAGQAAAMRLQRVK